jgi:hypothetical protein
MTTPFSGGCVCGSIRYVCSREPIAMLLSLKSLGAFNRAWFAA